jgi:hypothetical protein
MASAKTPVELEHIVTVVFVTVGKNMFATKVLKGSLKFAATAMFGKTVAGLLGETSGEDNTVAVPQLGGRDCAKAPATANSMTNAAMQAIDIVRFINFPP